MVKQYDAIIVGAGPSGSTAAFVLAQAGLKVALVDKSEFPRDKLCGGGLTGRSIKAFKEIFACDLKDILEFESHGIAFYNKGQYLNKLENYQSLNFIYRCDFDHYLASKAEQAGAEFIQGFNIADIDAATNTITDKQGKQYHANFIVGADGIKSIVSRKIFSQSFDKNRYAIAMEAEIDRDAFGRHVHLPEIYYGSVEWGYGWVFPKKDRITVGIAGLYKHNKDIKKLFVNFLQNDLGLSTDVAMKGYYLPFGQYNKKLAKGSVLLVGDAAGLVDPITGEGIAFALESGQMAAQSIIEASQADDPQSACVLYKNKVKKITRCIDHANYVKYLIYPEFFKRLLIKGLATSTDKNSIRYYLDLMADDITYPQYISRLIKKSGKKIVKLMFMRKRLNEC